MQISSFSSVEALSICLCIWSTPLNLLEVFRGVAVILLLLCATISLLLCFAREAGEIDVIYMLNRLKNHNRRGKKRNPKKSMKFYRDRRSEKDFLEKLVLLKVKKLVVLVNKLFYEVTHRRRECTVKACVNRQSRVDTASSPPLREVSNRCALSKAWISYDFCSFF